MAIDYQLKRVGLTPNDIKYVVASHLHLDHGGNVGKFPNSIIVVQKEEIQNAFWPEPGTGGPYILGDVMPLHASNSNCPNAQKMIQLQGDLDIFGDGSVVVKRWVGHTPGSQMMTVKLKNTGLVILTGDNVYFRENVEKSIPPNIVLAYKPDGIYAAYEWIRLMMATQKADFFTAHDPDAFRAMKMAPGYYDGSGSRVTGCWHSVGADARLGAFLYHPLCVHHGMRNGLGSCPSPDTQVRMSIVGSLNVEVPSCSADRKQFSWARLRSLVPWLCWQQTRIRPGQIPLAYNNPLNSSLSKRSCSA